VLCADEKLQIQALDRTATVLPMLPGTPQWASHDYYVRAGMSSPALNLAIGEVIGSLHQRRRAIEFKKFLIRRDREVRVDLDVHVVLDKASTHKTLATKRWPAARPASFCILPRPAKPSSAEP
jgi:hypothetical protein